MTIRAAAAVTVVALALALAGCTSPAAAPSDPSASSRTAASSSAPTTASWSAPDAAGRRRLAGFGEARLVVRTADGRELSPCVLLAATDATRRQGLMDVTDPALGGYDGMLFTFDEDTSSGFWMKDTLLPLSIAFVADGGDVVSTADMDPCPPGTDRCPTTRPDQPYRSALEVPQGKLADLGITDAAQIAVAHDHC